MTEEKIKFFIINTSSLWDEGEKFNVVIDGAPSSLCLAKKGSYNYADKITLDITVKDFEIDSCGILYLITKESHKIALFDKFNNTLNEIDRTCFAGAEKIAVSDLDIFISKGKNITCFARVNYQKRWQRDVKVDGIERILDISATREGTIIVLAEVNGSKKVIKLERKYNKYDFDSEIIEEISLKDKVKNLGDVVYDPVSLTVYNQFLHIIYSDDYGNSYKLLKLLITTYKEGKTIVEAKEETDELLPLKKGFVPNIMAVDREALIYLTAINTKEIKLIEPTGLFYQSGSYITKRFDSGTKGYKWHKVNLDMQLPKNTRVELSYVCSDDKRELDLEKDSPLWDNIRLTNPKDSLLPKVDGQHIRLRIRLFSDDTRRSSPKIMSLRIEFPRHSYLRYLPAVFQENKAGKEFLERLLPLFETFFSYFEESIFSLTKYFDADATTDEFLPWLQQWLGLSYDENWPPEKVRKLINRAPYLYKMRGTKTGIEEIIKLYIEDENETKEIERFDEMAEKYDSVKDDLEYYKKHSLKSVKSPIISEGYQTKKCLKEEECSYSLLEIGNCDETDNTYLILNTVEGLMEENIIKIKNGNIGKYAVISKIIRDKKKVILRGRLSCNNIEKVSKVSIEELLGETNPFAFSVLFKPFALSDQQLHTIKRIVDIEKPAHTVGYVKELEPWFYLDSHTYLGINAILSDQVYILGRGIISRDTVLSEREWSGQMGISSIINDNTKLT